MGFRSYKSNLNYYYNFTDCVDVFLYQYFIQDEIEVDGMDSVGIAFDSMTLNPATLSHVRLMLPALRPMFPKEVREMDVKRRNFDSNNFHERILSSLRND